ncbi:hypothetical protein IFM89_033123 [Coptis chinensis]|uniref:Cation-transporting P-type ATPase N-terminal domain-containing protein n=1 Tax=Coptis chinensis TaxID=261450 RepID=A0A835HEB5_9MAGN|nr:hypothetical protein IFM89_033123 [Coptis chinensis]
MIAIEEMAGMDVLAVIKSNFDPQQALGETKDGLTSASAEERLVIFGHNKLEEKKESKFLKFLGFMWNPLSWVMGSGAIMAIALANGGCHKWCDGAIGNLLKPMLGRGWYELHHGVRISDSALVAVCNSFGRYIGGSFLRTKLMRPAKLKMEITSKPTALDEINRPS